MKTAVHQYEDRLLEFAYGELPAPEAAAVDAHVRSCPRCTESLVHLRSVRSSMQQLPFEAAPDAGLDSLLAIAAQQAERNAKAAPQPWWKTLLTPRWMTSLASVGALMVVGVVAFRTSREFSPDAGALAVQAQASRDDQTPARYKSEAKEEVAAASPAPAPPPPAEQDAIGSDTSPRSQIAVPAAEPPQASASGEAEARAPKTEQEKSNDTPSKANLLSKAKRKAAPELKKLVRDDYSNARGAPAQVAADEPAAAPSEALSTSGPSKADRKPGAPTDGTAYGLGSGENARRAEKQALAHATTDKERAAEPTRGGGQVPANKDLDSTGALGGVVGGSTTNAGPKGAANEDRKTQPSPAAASPAPVVSKKAPSSLGLRSLQGSATKEAQLEEGDLAGRREQPVMPDVTALRRSNLEAARSASQREDRAQEIQFSLAVLEGGATGAERLEALKRVCDAYQALGQDVQADPFCDQVLREFPSSPSAQALARKRSYQQQPHTADQSKASTPAKPAPEKPVKSAPSKPADAY